MNDLSARPASRPLVWPDNVLELFDRLADVEQPAYIVGGAVRDALLRHPIKDVDITTPGSGLKLARQIANLSGGAYYPLDTERDIGRALIDDADGKLVIDVSRFRGDDLLSDLTDRDFTLNAMAVDVQGDPGWLIDPTGGEQDAINRLLRRCNPEAIARDPVRALRAVRQSAQLGLRIEPATLADVRTYGPRMVDASSERVRDETFRLLGLPEAATALKVADSLGLLTVALPETHWLHEHGTWARALMTVERLTSIYTTFSPQRTDETAARFSLGIMVMGLDRYRSQLYGHLTTNWADDRHHMALLVFGALYLHVGDAELAEARAAQLPLSNRERERLTLILRNFETVRDPDDLSPLGLHRYWRPLGAAGVDVCVLALADYLAGAGLEINQDGWIRRIERARTLLGAYFEHYDELVEPPVLLDGKALMTALGLKSGPVVGKLLTAIREAQVMGEVTTPDAALALARQVVETG